MDIQCDGSNLPLAFASDVDEFDFFILFALLGSLALRGERVTTSLTRLRCSWTKNESMTFTTHC